MAVRGNTSDHAWVLYAHIAVAIVGVGLISKQYRLALACLAIWPAATYTYERFYEKPAARISNRTMMIPTSMEEEGERKGAVLAFARQHGCEEDDPFEFLYGFQAVRGMP